jgi:hypothetical protein
MSVLTRKLHSPQISHKYNENQNLYQPPMNADNTRTKSAGELDQQDARDLCAT